MDLKQAMSALQSHASESCKKTYLRHGAKEPLFGVRTGDLGTLKKRIKIDHELAEALIATGNADARLLGFMVADPDKLDASRVEGWLAQAVWSMDTYYLGQLLARSPIWFSCMQRWMAQSDEWVQSAGYSLLAQRLKEDADSVPDDLAAQTLVAIEKGIHRAKNRARDAMNTALIAIGTYKPGLRDAALAAAERIGPVEVDHGDTACKTPLASEYIRKAGAHADRMAAKKAKPSAKPSAKSTIAKPPAAAKKTPAKAAAAAKKPAVKTAPAAKKTAARGAGREARA